MFSVIQLETGNRCPFVSWFGYQSNQQADPNPSTARKTMLEGMHVRSYNQPTPMAKRPTCSRCRQQAFDSKPFRSKGRPCCTGLSQGYTHPSTESLQNFKVLYESHSQQTAWSRGTSFVFWPSYTNASNGNHSSAGSMGL